MAESKTKPTFVGVQDFIASVPNETRREDAQTLLKLFEKATGWKAQMWGPTLVGFGRYDYVYETGNKGSSLVVGFSPRSTSLVIYSGFYMDQPEAQALVKTLGKHKTAKACLYINKLADIDRRQLEKLIKGGVANMKKLSKEKGWTLTPG